MPASRDIKLIGVLALIAGLGPITIHVMLPVLPVIAHVFAVDGATAQLALSLPLVAMAFSTLAYGPAADRYGRKPVLLAGLALFIAGSAMCLWAPTIDVLIAGRVVQAVGGAAGIVISRAIIRDTYSREQTASVIGYVMSIVVLAPIFAPAIGGVLAEAFDWHAVFAMTLAMGALALMVVIPAVRETHRPVVGVNLFGQMLAAFPDLLRDHAFLAYAGYAGFGMGTFMVIAGGVSFLLVEVFDRSPSAFGFFFMTVTASFMAGTIVSARITQRVGIDRMLRLASAGVLLSGAAVPALFLAGLVSPWSIFGPGFAIGFFHGLAMPNAQAGGVSVNPRAAGSASGLMMFLQLTVGATMAQAAGTLPHHDPMPVVWAIALVTAGCFLNYNGFMWLQRRRSRGAT